LFFYSQIRGFIIAVNDFNAKIVADNAEEIRVNPYPVIVWGVLALAVFAAGIVLPFAFRKVTKLSQKQYDLWVFGVLLVRILVLVGLLNLMGEHMHVIHPMAGSNPLSLLTNAALTVIAVLFTKYRIKLLEPKKEKKPPRDILED
jgi:hypothetical protein